MVEKHTLSGLDMLKIARTEAIRIAPRLPASILIDDLVSAACERMVLTRLRKGLGVWSHTRAARYGIWDYLRNCDHMTRHGRRGVNRGTVCASTLVYLDGGAFVDGGSPLEDTSMGMQDERVYLSELRELIDSAIKKLNPVERHIMEMYWADGKTQLQIGKELRISESRVCQIIGVSVRKIKATTGGLGQHKYRDYKRETL